MNYQMPLPNAKAFQECSPEEIAAFRTLLLDGGQVPQDGLDKLISQSACLVFLSSDAGETIAIGALKVPRASYRQRIFANANSTLDPDLFPYELGWIVIAEHHRGKRLSLPIADAALRWAKRSQVFATTAVDNLAMQRTLTKLGFVQTGQQYAGRQTDILLFVCDRQLRYGEDCEPT